MKRKHVIIAIAGVAIAAAGSAATAPAGLVGGLFGTPTERVGFMLTHAGGWGIEGGIAYVEAELAITDAQRPQWDALADTVRENVGAVQAAFERRHGGAEGERSTSAVERLDAFEDLATVGLDVLRKVSPPFKALYAVLSEEQKERADSLIDRRGHRRSMHH